MKRKALAMSLVVSSLVTLLVGCGGSSSGSAGTAAATQAAAETKVAATQAAEKVGDVKDVVKVACAAEADAFFPWHSKLSTNMDEVPILHNVYESLIKLGPDNSHEPLLATDWKVSEDGCTYTLTIRDDVYFHNGEKMTVEDVEFSLDNAGHTSAGSAQLANYDDTEIIDDHTVAVHLTSPYGPFLNALAGRYALVVDKSYYEAVGEDGYNENPIGTGPYTFTERVSGSHIVLDANENYWGGVPAIKQVRYQVMTDTNTQMISLENGDIDVLINANVSSLMKLASDKVEWATNPASSIDNLKFNCNEGPAADVNFRKAVLYGINKEDVNIGVYEGQATVGDIPAAPGFSGRPDDGTFQVVEYDQEKAKEYLAQSDYNGEEFEIVCVSGTRDESVAQIVQGQLMAIGINCTVSAVDSASFKSITEQTGDFDASLRFSGVSVLDADGMYYQYHRDYAIGAGIYYYGNSNDELCQLLDEARVAVDPEARKQLYAKANDVIVENAFGACILYELNACAYNSSLKGVVPRSLTGLYFFNDWSW